MQVRSYTSGAAGLATNGDAQSIRETSAKAEQRPTVLHDMKTSAFFQA